MNYLLYHCMFLRGEQLVLLPFAVTLLFSFFCLKITHYTFQMKGRQLALYFMKDLECWWNTKSLKL